MDESQSPDERAGEDEGREAPAESPPAPSAPAPLRPARPDPFEDGRRPDYMPKIPWRTALIFGGLFVLVAGGYQVREEQQRETLRADVLRTHETQLTSIAERYRAFRELIEQRTLEAASAGEPERWVDPRLRVSGLHEGVGVYLRLTAEEAASREGIERAALTMAPDALTRCLGIAPSSVRGLYESGRFLTREWLDEVRTTPERMRLRVLDEQLARSVQVDVPTIATLLGAQYFLLVIQQGESRRDAPVDVFLWDLRQDRQLLRARIQARGILLPVRLHFDGVTPAPRPAVPPAMHSTGASDCSIAAQIKAMTGEAPVSVGAAAAALDADREATDDAPATRAPSAAEAPRADPTGAPSPAGPSAEEPAPAAARGP